MAWGDRDKLIAANARMETTIALLKDQIVDLKLEKKELRVQLQHTQEALIAKEAPEAYRDRKYAEEQAAIPPLSAEQKEQQRVLAKRAEVASQYVRDLEGPLFTDADDMISTLMGAVGVPLSESSSLHGNDES